MSKVKKYGNGFDVTTGAFNLLLIGKKLTAWKVSKYGVSSGPYSVQIRENTDQKKLRIWELFAQYTSVIRCIYKHKQTQIRKSAHVR